MEKQLTKQSNKNLMMYEKVTSEYMKKRKELDKKEKLDKVPKKRNYRVRAHCNPLSDTPFPFPLNPSNVNWTYHFPNQFKKQGIKFPNEEDKKKLLYLNTRTHPIATYEEDVEDKFNGKSGPTVNIIDIGCGYGGLLFALSPHFIHKNIMGFEIRDTIVEYVGKKIRALRIKEDKYHNISVLRTNTMRHLTNYIRQSQLDKIFICFPDPNFKKSKFNRRIVNLGFLSEYAYCLKNGGKLYCITDVKDLHDWHVKHLEEHSLFRKISDEEMKTDICYKEMFNKTEEGQKVERNKGDKFACIYECIKDN